MTFSPKVEIIGILKISGSELADGMVSRYWAGAMLGLMRLLK